MDLPTTDAADDVVGDDRDAVRILDTLERGVSIVLVGPLGSGKTHFVRHLVQLLETRGRSPIVLRSGAPRAAGIADALEASADPRALSLREGRNPPGGERPIVVIDDAHDLDAASIEAVVRAVFGGRAAVLFALTVSRDGSTRAPGAEPDAAQMAVDLWLRGLADRVDLASLTPRDAGALLDRFGPPELDSFSRAAIVALADGSRMLLRELAATAAHAIREGRDPVDALSDSAPHTRLSDALGAHVSQLAPAERTTLAILGRVRGIARADAVRFLPAAVVDTLIAARLVHDDGTPGRHLTANAALAREADRRTVSKSIDAVIESAAARMLSEPPGWWSPSLAVLAADAWLHGSSLGVPFDAVSPATVVRAAVDAARRANDEGDPALATAFARLGMMRGTSPALDVEMRYAEAIEGNPVDIEALVDRLTGHPVDGDTLLRCVKIISVTDPTDAARMARSTERIAALTCPDARAAGEMTLLRAQIRGFAMDWAAAVESAEALLDHEAASASLRTRAALLAGLGHTCLGSWEKGRSLFMRAHRAAGERGGISPITTSERLWGISLETIAAALTGTDLQPALARLAGEVDAAARESDPEARALAGLVLASTYAAMGQARMAARELGAAVRRARAPGAAGWVPFAQISVTRALALSGSAEEAAALLEQVDAASLANMPMLAHARMVAETYVATALGDTAHALSSAKAAGEASARLPTLRARDLYQRVALGDADEALPEMRRMAEHSEVPATRSLTELASTLVADGEDDGDHALTALRRSTPWDGPQPDPRPELGGGITRGRPLPPPPPPSAEAELTRREREIALLVAEGLGNREIADQLYLSVRTVESHIYQARTKLGARSRGELGRVVRTAAHPTG